MEKLLPSELGNIYGAHLTCQLIITEAHLLVALASTINELPIYKPLVI